MRDYFLPFSQDFTSVSSQKNHDLNELYWEEIIRSCSSVLFPHPPSSPLARFPKLYPHCVFLVCELQDYP